MYANEEDVYGDEIDGEEDKNDGLNALVYFTYFIHTFRIYNGLLV